MDLQMSEIESQSFEFNGETFWIDTGKVENGWWWESPGFRNSEGVCVSRDSALEAAKREIQARGGMTF